MPEFPESRGSEFPEPTWWTVYVDVADSEQVDVGAIVPGKSIGLRLLMEIAIGSEEDSRKYLDEYIRLTRPAAPSSERS